VLKQWLDKEKSTHKKKDKLRKYKNKEAADALLFVSAL
jgi:hypothetical protein